MIENPQPAWLPLLLLALPGLFFAACAANTHIFPRNDRPLCTIPAVALVLALLPTHVLSLALGSLSTGLTISWSIVGVVGYTWILKHWQDFRSVITIKRPDRVRKLAIAMVATVPIILPTILLNFHDEVNFHSHQGIIANIQNGTYPPHYLYEPSLLLRYHYAFDLSGAIVTGLLRIRLDQAIDLLTVALWPSMFLLLWRIGEHFGGKQAGMAVALAVCFSGGSPTFAWIVSECGLCPGNGLRAVPPFISYFFQHPWSLGVPIFCLVILQRAAFPQIRNRILGLTALILSLTLLSLSEAVLFVMTVGALAATEVWRVWRSRERDSILILLALGLSLLGAKVIGGFFVDGAYPPASGLLDSGFYVHDFSTPDAVLWQILWNLASFGFLLPLGTIGLRRTKSDKLFLVILAIVILVIVNTLRYRYTSEINKFGAVGLIVLAVGAGIALSDFASKATTFVRRVIWVVLVVGLVWQGLHFPIYVLFSYDPDGRSAFSNQMITPYFSSAYPVDQDDARAVSFLRTHVGASEMVYRSGEKSEPYVIWGGLPTQVTWYLYATEMGKDDVYGLGDKKFAARRDLSDITETWFERLSAQHITWVVTDPDDVAINAILDCPEGQHRAVLAARYGKVRVFHLR